MSEGPRSPIVVLAMSLDHQELHEPGVSKKNRQPVDAKNPREALCQSPSGDPHPILNTRGESGHLLFHLASGLVGLHDEQESASLSKSIAGWSLSGCMSPFLLGGHDPGNNGDNLTELIRVSHYLRDI